jgi:hypothetical protein
MPFLAPRCDGYAVLRAGLAVVRATEPGFEVVGGDRYGTIRMLGGFEEARSDPAVVAQPTDGSPGDEALAEAVGLALRLDAATTGLVVGIAVRSGVVRLQGGVSDLDDAENAGAVAAAVPGVSDAVDELEIEGDGRR